LNRNDNVVILLHGRKMNQIGNLDQMIVDKATIAPDKK